jgi:hypothetical protein
LTYDELIDCEVKPGFCMIEPRDEPDHVGSIILPEIVERRTEFGLVKQLHERDEPGFERHDWVVFKRMAAKEIYRDPDKTLCYLRNADVLAVWT